jgi:hypothetical protein
VVGVTLSHALEVCGSVTVGPPIQELEDVEMTMDGELLVLQSLSILSVAPFWQPLLELVPVEC